MPSPSTDTPTPRIDRPTIRRSSKRKKPLLSREEQDQQHQQHQQQQQQDYYNRLLHQCRKDLHKHTKLTKNFEVQKLIRSSKTKNATTSVTSSTTTDTTTKLDRKLLQLKAYSSEPVIQECFRRLGLPQLDPQQQQQQYKKNPAPPVEDCCEEEEEKDTTNNSKTNSTDAIALTTTTTTSVSLSDGSLECCDSVEEDSRHLSTETRGIETDHPTVSSTATTTTTAIITSTMSTTTNLVDDTTTAISNTDTANNEEETTDWILPRILRHKSMVNALEAWNEQVTEYRRWCLRQQDKREGRRMSSEPEMGKSKKSKQQKGHNSTNTNAPPFGGLFVTLGDEDGGGGTSDYDDVSNVVDPLGYYGPGGGGAAGAEPKRNRQGQRGRRAKAAAVAAKQQGRTLLPEESLNWRSGNNNTSNNSSSNNSTKASSRSNPQHQHQPKAPLPPPESLHPSWQARKEQKDGIVAFQGKKITFGSDD